MEFGGASPFHVSDLFLRPLLPKSFGHSAFHRYGIRSRADLGSCQSDMVLVEEKCLTLFFDRSFVSPVGALSRAVSSLSNSVVHGLVG